MTTTTITQESTISTANVDATVAYPIATCDQPVVTIRLNITSKRQTSLLSILNKRMGSGKQFIPALNYASAIATASGIMITGADMIIQVPGQGSGEFTFPINDLLCRFAGDVVLSNGELRTTDSSITWQGLSLNDLPCNCDYRHGFISRLRLQGIELLQKLSMVAYAQAKNDVRYYLNGVCFEIVNGRLRLIATDGHRLGTTKVDVVSHDTLLVDRQRFILEREDVATLTALAKLSKSVVLSFFESHVEIKGEDWVIVCKYIDATYPDWAVVVPNKDNQQNIILSKNDMFTLVSHLKQRKTNKFGAVKIELDENGKLTVQSQSDVGQDAIITTDTIRLDFLDQPMMESRGFNRIYLIDALKTAITAGVNVATFGFGDTNNSITVRFDDFIGVVMPMRL